VAGDFNILRRVRATAMLRATSSRRASRSNSGA